jgi:Cdc6-like AAA superfamily ATPase
MQLINLSQTETLKSLTPVLAARYDSLASPSGCLEGTRVDIVAGLLDWCAQEINRFSIYWLVGHAGTGKTTIAKTLCEHLASQGTLWLATFFVSKTYADRRDPLRMLYSFVYELAGKDIITCKRVLTGIRSHDDIKQRPLREQIEQLLYAPLRAAVGGRQLILVLDALDECSTVAGVKGGDFIQELADRLADLVRMVSQGLGYRVISN